MQGFLSTSQHTSLYSHIKSCIQSNHHVDTSLRLHHAYFARLIDFCDHKVTFVEYYASHFVISKEENKFVARALTKEHQDECKRQTISTFSKACQTIPALYKDIQSCIVSYFDYSLSITSFQPEQCFVMAISPSLSISDITTLLGIIAKQGFYQKTYPLSFYIESRLLKFTQNNDVTHVREYTRENLLSDYVLTLDYKGNIACVKWNKYKQTIPLESIDKEDLLKLRVKNLTSYYVYNPKETKAERQLAADTFMHELLLQMTL